MRDRTERKYVKKPDQRLKKATLFTLLFTAIFASFGLTLILSYSNKNEQLAQRIDNYQSQIETLEEKNDSYLLQQKNP